MLELPAEGRMDTAGWKWRAGHGRVFGVLPGHHAGRTITSERRSVLGSIILAFFSGQQGRPYRHGTALLGTSEVVRSGTGSSGGPHVVRLLSAGGEQQRVWVLPPQRAGAVAPAAWHERLRGRPAAR